MTRGEYLVGLDFNPSANPVVTDLKQKAAAFIDAANNIPKVQEEDTSPEARAAAEQVNADIGRLRALAITHAEDAAMWAVKAATKKPRT